MLILWVDFDYFWMNSSNASLTLLLSSRPWMELSVNLSTFFSLRSLTLTLGLGFYYYLSGLYYKALESGYIITLGLFGNLDVKNFGG